MTYKVLISDKIEEICPRVIREAGYQADEKSGLSPEELGQIIGSYHGLVVRSATQVTADILARGAAGNLKIVARAGAGIDNIDVDEAKGRNVKVVNTPGVNANAVAELTLGFAFILARNLGPAILSMREGRWEKKGLAGIELRGKVMGLVGLGAVGRLVASKAKALGMSVLAMDPLLRNEDIEACGASPVGNKERIWAEADFISLHLPKLPDTVNTVDAKALSLMKKSAYLINCARGGLVDEAALFQALSSGKLAGAAMDVFDKEPPTGSPLLSLPNFVAAPHLGASTLEAQLGVAEEAARLLVAFFKSGKA
jgi:D-3-phosphoglycerate dehydrogenase